MKMIRIYSEAKSYTQKLIPIKIIETEQKIKQN